jgi:hypothetical protein
MEVTEEIRSIVNQASNYFMNYYLQDPDIKTHLDNVRKGTSKGMMSYLHHMNLITINPDLEETF